MTVMATETEQEAPAEAPFAAPGSGAVPPQMVEDAMCEIERSRCALHAQFLSLVGHFIQTEDYRADGARDMGEWVARRFEMSPYQAREMARVAEALLSLPCIAAAYGEGELSWDQLRALTRYATPESDEALAQEARGLSLAGIERAARKHRRKDADEARRDQADDWVVKSRIGGGRLRFKGELSGERAAIVDKALDRALDRQPRPPEGEDPLPWDYRLAVAFAEVCGAAIAHDGDPDRATVVLHTEADVLAGDDLVADLEGIEICSETARRLCCDARVQEVLEIGGVPIGIGQVSRTVPPRLLRLLQERDRGCRFPGCSRRRWVHAHHVWHWGRGGPTDLGNLVLLCSYHHTFVHEEGWSIGGNPMGELEFVRPTGDILPAGLAA